MKSKRKSRTEAGTTAHCCLKSDLTLKTHIVSALTWKTKSSTLLLLFYQIARNKPKIKNNLLQNATLNIP